MFRAKILHERRKHEKPQRVDSIPETEEPPTEWITSPMLTWDGDSEAFSPRHESSAIELFFDLFFVANLATFTDYHAITNRDNFASYVAFFIILWGSWFQITTFDVRFASDSVWERACKLIQCLYFITLALVGYKADPTFIDASVPDWVHQTLCFALLIQRGWMALQYLVVTVFSTRPGDHPKGVVLPLALQTTLFAVVAIIYGSLAAGFNNGRGTISGFYTAIYLTTGVEMIGTLAISIGWRKLSFRATHLNERLGLLGIIIIGEGAIGLTKTIINIMGKDGPYFEGYALVFSNVLVLLLIWQLYYDNLPKYRFGVIKQQLWAVLHLPIHLGILGVVEGSRQIVVARYQVYKEESIVNQAYDARTIRHLDGSALASALNSSISALKLYDNCPGNASLPLIYQEINALAEQPGVCSPANTTVAETRGPEQFGLPESFIGYLARASGGLVQSLDLDYEPESEESGFEQSLSARGVVYTYYWGALLMLLACLTISALLAEEGHRLARSRAIAVFFRTMVVAGAVTLLTLGNTDYEFFLSYTGSAWVLPTVVLMLWTVAMGDRISKSRLHKRRQEKSRKSSGVEESN